MQAFTFLKSIDFRYEENWKSENIFKIVLFTFRKIATAEWQHRML